MTSALFQHLSWRAKTDNSLCLIVWTNWLPTPISRWSGEITHNFHPIFTSFPKHYSNITVLPPLMSASRSFINVARCCPVSYSRCTTQRNNSLKYDDFRDFLTYYPWNVFCFDCHLCTSASDLTNITLQGMNLFVTIFQAPKNNLSNDSVVHLFVLFAWSA